MLPPFRDAVALNSPLNLTKLPNDLSWTGKIAFLDRDGVINAGSENYINNPEEVKLLPNIGKCIGNLRRSGFRICVVTNQSPIGRGLWSHENLHIIHTRICDMLIEEDEDAILDLILYSPYSPWDGSWARKPNPGMLEAGRQILDAAVSGNKNNLQILYDDEWMNRPNESNSIMVGDRNVDLLAARYYGVQFFQCEPEIGLFDVISLILGDNDE